PPGGTAAPRGCRSDRHEAASDRSGFSALAWSCRTRHGNVAEAEVKSKPHGGWRFRAMSTSFRFCPRFQSLDLPPVRRLIDVLSHPRRDATFFHLDQECQVAIGGLLGCIPAAPHRSSCLSSVMKSRHLM